jgi:hypothetical protein
MNDLEASQANPIAETTANRPAAPGVALKMGRRLRCSSVTPRTILTSAGENQICRTVKMVRDAPSNASPARTALPAAHFERNEAQGI